MAEETILTFNAPNILTVTIMAALGFTALAAIARVVKNARAK